MKEPRQRIDMGIAEQQVLLAGMGYLTDDCKIGTRCDRTRLALAEFRQAYRCGTEDDVKSLMECPRCGRPDPDGGVEAFTLSGCKWPKNELTYLIHDTTEDFDSLVQLAVLSEAFRAWSDVTPLKFTRAEADTDSSDIHIYFKSRIDGPGNTLAYAYYPGQCGGNRAGTIVFDDSEQWTEEFLLEVAIHEIGHGIGIGHSNNSEAIMFAFSNGVTNLHLDDIEAAQELYGMNIPDPIEPDEDNPVGDEMIFGILQDLAALPAGRYEVALRKVE